MTILCTLDEFKRQALPPIQEHSPSLDSQTQSMGINYEGDFYIVVKVEDNFFAYLNKCPHLNIPLEWQAHQFIDEDTQLIRCSTHGALFMPSNGECVSGPCSGEALEAVAITVSDTHIALA